MRKPTDESLTTLKGRVEAVFFASPDFSAGRLRAEGGETVHFAGPIMVRLHDPVVLHGSWEQHPKFGRQFRVARFAYDQGLDADGLAHYLANHPDIKGIGPVKAKRIAEAFGADFERVLEQESERIAEVARIPIETVDELRTEWSRTRALNASLTWLAGFGLTHHQVTTLVKKFGNNIVAVLKTDPYLIVREIRGFGFKRVDAVARKMGTPKDHPPRIRAGLVHCVEERLGDGDCWVDYEELIELANALLVMDVLDSRARIEAALDALVADGQLACVSLGGRFLIARPDMHRMETDLAASLTKGLRPNPHFADVEDLAGLIADVAPELNEGQRAAVTGAARHNQALISGGAGSGKTFTVAAITRLYEERGLKVILAAPTGKAAKRLEQVVRREAFTLHRLLGFNGREFARGPDDAIDADVIVVDEVSMVDVPLAWQLYRAVDLERTAIVLVGDHNQLPPVGPGNLLRDLIERQPIPTVVLDKIVRQAGVLKENSIAILQGEVRKTAAEAPDGRRPWYLVDQFTDVWDVQRFVLELYEKVLAERLRFDLLADVQLLTPTRKGPLGVDALNAELQRLLQKRLWGVDVPVLRPGRRPEFLVRDKVIQTRNNYDLGVMNGAIGIVTSVGPKRGELRVRFDDIEVEISPETKDAQDLSLAYALTIHKSQGSEFPCAVVIVHKSHSFMHHRNLFYTGVTRARQVAVVIGDRWGLRNCAEKQQVERRKTFLSILDLPAPPAGGTG